MEDITFDMLNNYARLALKGKGSILDLAFDNPTSRAYSFVAHVYKMIIDNLYYDSKLIYANESFLDSSDKDIYIFATSFLHMLREGKITELDITVYNSDTVRRIIEPYISYCSNDTSDYDNDIIEPGGHEINIGFIGDYNNKNSLDVYSTWFAYSRICDLIKDGQEENEIDYDSIYEYMLYIYERYENGDEEGDDANFDVADEDKDQDGNDEEELQSIYDFIYNVMYPHKFKFRYNSIRSFVEHVTLENAEAPRVSFSEKMFRACNDVIPSRVLNEVMYVGLRVCLTKYIKDEDENKEIDLSTLVSEISNIYWNYQLQQEIFSKEPDINGVDVYLSIDVPMLVKNNSHNNRTDKNMEEFKEIDPEKMLVIHRKDNPENGISNDNKNDIKYRIGRTCYERDIYEDIGYRLI